MIKGTIGAWATSLGIEPRTLQRSLVKAGIKVPEPRKTITAKSIFVAMAGDVDAEKQRLLKGQADAQERENREAEGTLVNMAEAEKFITEVLIIPLVNALEPMPTSLDVRCNPEHPEIARAALSQWVEDTKKLLRVKVKPEQSK